MSKFFLVILAFITCACTSLPPAQISNIKINTIGELSAEITFDSDRDLFKTESKFTKFSAVNIYCPITDIDTPITERSHGVFINGFVDPINPEGSVWSYRARSILDKSDQEKDRTRKDKKYNPKAYYIASLKKVNEISCSIIMVKAFGEASYSKPFKISASEIKAKYSLSN